MATTSRSSGAGLGFLGWILVLPLMSAAIYYPFSQGDVVLAGAVTFSVVAAILGHRAGAAKIIGLFVGGFVGAFYAPELTVSLEPLIKTVTGKEGLINHWIGFGVAIVGGSFITALVFQIIASVLSSGSPFLEITNMRIGFLLGGAQGMTLAVFVICGAFVIEPLARKRLEAPAGNDEQALGRTVAENVVKLCEETRPTKFGKFLLSVSPFEKVDSLKKLSNNLTALADPAALEKLLGEVRPTKATTDKLAKNPKVEAAVQQLTNDPQVRQILSSGRGLDASAMAAMLSNPTVQKLMQDPKLMQDVIASLPK